MLILPIDFNRAGTQPGTGDDAVQNSIFYQWLYDHTGDTQSFALRIHCDTVIQLSCLHRLINLQESIHTSLFLFYRGKISITHTIFHQLGKRTGDDAHILGSSQLRQGIDTLQSVVQKVRFNLMLKLGDLHFLIGQVSFQILVD